MHDVVRVEVGDCPAGVLGGRVTAQREQRNQNQERRADYTKEERLRAGRALHGPSPAGWSLAASRVGRSAPTAGASRSSMSVSSKNSARPMPSAPAISRFGNVSRLVFRSRATAL